MARTTSPRIARRWDATFVLFLATAIILGLFVRVLYVMASDFPLNDGGLFYVMVRELQQSHYALPDFTTYNSAGIPFAYPPLAFYLAGLLDDLTALSLLDVFRLLPLAANVLTIVAFAFLARDLLKSGVMAGFAVVAFALLPGSFTWQIMGGGLTRSLGFLFAVLAIHQTYLMYTRSDRKHVALAAALAGCTLLSHLEMAWFLAISITVFFIAHGRDRQGVLKYLVVALGAALVAAPWWVTVIGRDGLSPFLAASNHGSPLYSGLGGLLTLDISREPLFPLLGGLALLGTLVCLAERQLLLPAWLLAMYALDPRSAHQTAPVALAMLGGIGLLRVVLPLLEKVSGSASAAQNEGKDVARSGPAAAPQNRLVLAVLGFVLLYAAFSAMLGPRCVLVGLSPEERQAMQWIAENTPESSRFLLITSDSWAVDRSSEWFPALTNRVSVATAQGCEWKVGFPDRLDRHETLQECAARGSDCIEEWAEKTSTDFTYVYVAVRSSSRLGEANDDLCWSLRDSLRKDGRYRVLYENSGATVLVRERGAKK